MIVLALEYRDEAQFIAGIAICLAALRWGAMPERMVALVWLIVFEGGSLAYHFIFGPGIRLDELDVGFAVIDGLAAVLLVIIGLQANRLYTLWIAAFQLVAAASHLAREFTLTMTPLAYLILSIGPSYFQMILLLGGLVYHVRRKRVWGDYRDWRLGVATKAGQH